MMDYKTIYQVDAFTDRPFKGNPAGVMIVDKNTPTGWMQNMALEMNLSETALLFRRKVVLTSGILHPPLRYPFADMQRWQVHIFFFRRELLNRADQSCLMPKAENLSSARKVTGL